MKRTEKRLKDVDQELDDDFRLIDLPFRFPHYLEFKDKVFVSANGTSTSEVVCPCPMSWDFKI